MKAGILTFHQEDNYGAVLQAFALQRKLQKLNIESEFLDIVSNDGKDLENQASSRPSNPAIALILMQMREGAKRRHALFEDFRKEFLIISPTIQPVQAQEWAERYDLLLSGSDQVWNPSIPCFDMRYFLPFVPQDKRCSYAVSLGQDIKTSPNRDLVIRHASAFHRISVREASAREFLTEATQRDDIKVCLDPSLLLDAADYQDLILPKEQEPERFVLLFMVNYDKELHARAMEEARRRDLPLRCVSASFMPQVGLKAWADVSPRQWVTDIHDAELVLTNSFHGIALSLLFSRPFLASGLKGELSARNGRIGNLLEMFDLKPDGQDIQQVSPQVLNDRLGEARADSIDYLESLKA